MNNVSPAGMALLVVPSLNIVIEPWFEVHRWLLGERHSAALVRRVIQPEVCEFGQRHEQRYPS